jgi:hypothetical protein
MAGSKQEDSMLQRMMLAAALGALAAGSAAAQTAPAPPPAPPPPGFAPPFEAFSNPYVGRPEDRQDFVNAQNWRDGSLAEWRASRRAARKILAEAGPERVAYARQVAALLNARRCQEARAFALSKGELEMAGKAVVYCRMRYGEG